MIMPFPGMDPYLEHPVLWEGFHARLIPEIADQLQPRLDPHYIATVEERVFIEGPQRRIPDIWVQKVPGPEGVISSASADTDTAVILEVEDLEIHQKRIEILDLYNQEKLVAVIELLSPTNKGPGPGRESYVQKRQEILERDCHFLEMDLLRQGDHGLLIPEWRLQELQPFHYLACVNRWPRRKRFELYPRNLRQRLPRIKVPLAEPDPDVFLDLQAAVEQVYAKARYWKRIRYDNPCVPALAEEDQAWATKKWQEFKAGHAEWFATVSKGAN
jgi:hypothetical protein